MYGGCKDLKELFFNVESGLSPHEDIPEISMLPATNHGRTRGQVAFKFNNSYQTRLVETEVGLLGVGQNIGVGENNLVFKFVSLVLTPLGVDSRIRDGLMVSPRNLKRLEAMIPNRQQRHGRDRLPDTLRGRRFYERISGDWLFGNQG
ncbi:hypothetical protein N431DRAFT_471911 [Stipitochalara longipes BDJ]|nr:hypothetical protein N431DRAFT_471911 [Stipitochalara longipes BDJ]